MPLMPPTPSSIAKPAPPAHPTLATSVLGWSARRRVLVVLPAVVVLWLAVAWAQLEAAPW